MDQPLTSVMLTPLDLGPCRSSGEGIVTTDPLLSWCQMQASSQSGVHSSGVQAGSGKREQPLAAPLAAEGSAVGPSSGGGSGSGGGGGKQGLVDVHPWLIDFSELRFLRPIGEAFARPCTMWHARDALRSFARNPISQS